MNTKKKISLILAVLMCASVLATGCKKTEENTSLTDTTPAQVSELTQMTTTEESESETTTVTTTETETESETEETTEETTETTTETSASETSAETTTKATTAQTTTASKEWNETEISETMYTTQACYSRKRPIVGAETVAQYKKGTKVQVVAATDTGYYKLADGSFIHSDYLTDEKPASTTKASTTKETTAETTKNSGGSSSITTSHSVDYTARYGYKCLTKDQQKLYGDIVKAAENLETEVAVPSGLLSEDITKVYLMVFNQEPQLFWLSREIPSGYGSIKLKYEFSSKEDIAAVQKKIDSSVKSILSTANQYTSTFSKLKVFYDWIVKNNEFSKSENADTCSIMNGLVSGGYLQCNGYAKSMQYLCDLAGIDSMVVIGTDSEGHSHAWNVVYCDNGYYNLDSTWGDPINDHNSNYIRYNFFLVPDSWIKNDHLNVNLFFRSNGTTIKLFDPPACTKTACNYFKAYNKEFDNLDDAVQGMYDEIASAVKSGKNVATIRVTSKDLWDTLVTDKYFSTFQKYAKSCSGEVDHLSRQKTNNDGVLVVQYDIFYK